MLVAKNEALQFGQRRAAAAITSQTTETMASLLDTAGNALPGDMKKNLSYAQFALDGNWSKIMSGNGDAANAALGIVTKSLPPELARLAGTAQPLLTKELKKLLSGRGLSDLSDIMTLDGLMGLAGQFMPPWAGDALAIGNQLFDALPKALGDLGNLASSLDSLIRKSLPPELQAAWKALQDAGGLKGLLDLFDKPQAEKQGVNGPWAARLSDIVVCNGGVGPIVSPCLPTVLIGGMPAARIGDVVICNSLPIDAIAMGESTVLMGGLFAARREEDDTAHQGKITTGFPTVHIGKNRNNTTNLSQAGDCAKKAADAGAVTISGSGITAPLTSGCFGNSDGLGLGDALSNSLGDFSKDKRGG